MRLPSLHPLATLLAGVFAASCGSSPDVVEPDAPDRADAAGDEVAVPAGPSASDLAATLVARELERGNSWRYLSELTRIAPGRAAGSAAYGHAVRWAEQTMRQIGLVDVHTEPVVVDVWDRGPAAEARATLEDGTVLPLSVLAMTGSVPTDANGRGDSLIGGVAYVETYEDLVNGAVDLTKKIAFVDEGLPPTSIDPSAAFAALEQKMVDAATTAIRNGATAVLLRSPVLADDDVPRAIAVRYAGRRIPSATLGPRSADRLRDACRASAKPPRVELALACSTATRSSIESSVFGEIRGTQSPDEIVLVCSRLDASDVGQGAHDDGAGVAQVLAAARTLLTAGVRPERTVRFGLFVFGHDRQRGARAYVRDHSKELRKHVAALVALRGGFAPRGYVASARESAARRAIAGPPLIAVLDRYDAGRIVLGTPEECALSPLALGGIPVFDLFTDTQRAVDLERSALDTRESVGRRHLAMGAASLAFLAAGLASDVRP